MASDFGIPGIGPSRAEELQGAGISDRDAFFNATYDKISEIGNPQILKIWTQQMSQARMTNKMSQLDASKVQCELDIAARTHKTIGELDVPIESVPLADLPASCSSEHVLTLLMQEQHFVKWREYIRVQVQKAREIMNEQRQAAVPVVPAPGTVSGPPPPPPPSYLLINTTNHMFFARRDRFQMLFPKAGVLQVLNVSDAVGSLLQALVNGDDVPEEALLHSISDQLVNLAQKYDLHLLRFLAEDYDKYPPKPFKFEHMFGAALNTEAMEYFVNNSIEPLSSKLDDYILKMSQKMRADLAKKPDTLASLWLQTLRMFLASNPAGGITPANRTIFQALENLVIQTRRLLEESSSPDDTNRRWQKALFKKLQKDALKRRATNTFNLLAAFKNVLDGASRIPDPDLTFTGTLSIRYLLNDTTDPNRVTQIDADTAKILLSEKVPLLKAQELGVTLDPDQQPDDTLQPFYDALRASFDSPDTMAEFEALYTGNYKLPLHQRVFRSGQLTTDDDFLWAWDLAAFLGPAKTTDLWGKDFGRRSTALGPLNVAIPSY
jgi:hypothetical protein